MTPQHPHHIASESKAGSARLFRFGTLMYQPFEGRTWADTAKEVEALGYASIGLTDHFQAQHAPIPTMAMVTAATEHLIATSMVLDNDFRHPLVLAKELATLDVESRGRIEFGIGAGWKRLDYDVSGIAYDRPGVRVGRMIEAVRIIRSVFNGEEFSFTGKHYTITDYAGLPLPHTPGGPRLFIGGGGPRVLRAAGELADIVGINPNLAAGQSTVETARSARAADFAAKLDAVRAGAATVQRSLDDLEFTTIVSCEVTDSSAATAAAYEAKAQQLGISVDAARDLQDVLIGSVDEIVEALIERRERFGLSYIVGVPATVRSLVPVVAALSGK